MTASETGIRSSEDVCSLPRDQRSDRAGMIRRDILPHATRREALANGVALEFEHTAAMQKTLADLVAFERDCCGGLAWNLTQPSDGVLRLSIEGLPPDSDFFREADLIDTEPAPGFTRIAQTVGLGVGGALFFCCVLPLGIAAVAGAALAAPLATLDNPLAITLAAIGLAIPTWFWLKRRAAHSAQAGCGDGC